MFDDLQAPQKKQHTDHMRTATKKPERKRGLATPASMDAKKAAVVHHEALKEAKLVEEEKLVAANKHKATMKARTSHKKAAKASRKKIHMVNPHDILNQIHEILSRSLLMTWPTCSSVPKMWSPGRLPRRLPRRRPLAPRYPRRRRPKPPSSRQGPRHRKRPRSPRRLRSPRRSPRRSQKATKMDS